MERESKDPKMKSQVNAVVLKLDAAAKALEDKNTTFAKQHGNDLKRMAAEVVAELNTWVTIFALF